MSGFFDKLRGGMARILYGRNGADALNWAIGSGIINGMEGNTLQPKGGATRAQIATVIMRYCENIVK